MTKILKLKDKFEISQRRYLGNKNSILYFIEDIINSEIGEFNSLCDLFSGTGVVGSYFNSEDKKIISNDLLYSNYISLYAFLSDDKFNEKKVLKLINEFNNLESKKDNYFSINFGNRYFSLENAKKIGEIREAINDKYLKNEINFKEKAILLTSLLYAMDRIANTVGHYDAYIKKAIPQKKLKLKMLDTEVEKNKNNKIYDLDANILIREIESDILYIDPPYNSRQYCDAYHLLENLIKWDKPNVFGVAKKFDRTHLKSEYNKANATKAFADLIDNAKVKYILFSYNNMADKGNSRSNARIKDEDIKEILSKKGKIKIFEKEYKEFNTGKSKRGDNKERVFFVEVNK